MDNKPSKKDKFISALRAVIPVGVILFACAVKRSCREADKRENKQFLEHILPDEGAKERFLEALKNSQEKRTTE